MTQESKDMSAAMERVAGFTLCIGSHTGILWSMFFLEYCFYCNYKWIHF